MINTPKYIFITLVLNLQIGSRERHELHKWMKKLSSTDLRISVNSNFMKAISTNATKLRARRALHFILNDDPEKVEGLGKV